MATNRTIIFADGENLVLRYQELAKTRKVNPNVTHIPDAFIWHQNITSGWKWLDVIRVSYYTSIVGDDDKLDELRKKIASVQYEFKTEVRREQGRICPHVFKRSSKSQKTKIVDVNLVIDVLRHTYNDSLDVVVLLSGDGDYLPLIREVMRTGKQVVVGAFSSGLHSDLPVSADNFINLDEWFFYQEA